MKTTVFHWCLGVVVGSVAAGIVPARAATTLFDFEAENEPAPRLHGDGALGVTNAFASSGARALFLQSGPWRKGLAEWPSFNLKTSVRDWRAYDRLVIDLASVGEGEDLLSVLICGPAGRVQNGLPGSTRLPARGFCQWVIPLANWPATCDPANIGRVHLFLSRPKDTRVFIDRVTLLARGEPLPFPDSPCLTRDLLPFLSKSFADAAALRSESASGRVHARAYSAFREACAKAGQDTARLCVGVASPMTKVMPRGDTIPAAPATNATVRLARNERESVQIVVAPGDRDLKNVRVSVSSDLTRADGTLFAASNISCEVVGYVRTRRAPPYKIGVWTSSDSAAGRVRETRDAPVGWWPDPLLNFLDGVDVKDTDAQSFWIRVRCPETQKAGVYHGALTVSVDGAAAVRIPFNVRVNDFAVPKAPPLPLAVTFAPGSNAEFTTPDIQQTVQQLRHIPARPAKLWSKHAPEWGDFLAEYYLTMDNLYHHGQIQWDILLKHKREGRLGKFNLGYWSYPGKESDEQWRARKLKPLKAAYDKAKELGLLEHAYVYGCDEVETNHFDNIRRAVRMIKQELPGVPVSTTAYDDEFGVNTPLDVMDWFTPKSSKFDVEKAKLSRKAGHQVWWYICCFPHAPYANMFIECPAIETRMLMGAQTARMRPDGFLYYQISIWNAPACITSGPFTDWDPRSWSTYHGDGSWVCVGPDGLPLPTVRLENFRDGLEDYAYALLLERKLKSRADRNDAWTRQARELLAVPDDVMESMTQFTGDPAVLLRWRDAMADLISEE